MTNKSLTELTKEAQEKHKKILKYIRAGAILSYELARELYEIKTKKLFRYVYGEGCNTWGDYLREIKMSRGTADNLIMRYKLYHLEAGIPIEELAKASPRALQYAFPLVKKALEEGKKEQIEEWVKKAQLLAPEDFEREYIQEIKEIKPETCEHEIRYKVWCIKCREDFTGDYEINPL